MNPSQIIADQKKAADKALDHALAEFNSLHTGKASPAMVENVQVEVASYGTSMMLRDIAAITTPDARTISIQPWDKEVLKDIEKALQKANIGINPAVQGTIIRLNIPELSRERRQELVKVAQSHAENGRVSIRQVRRDAMDMLKELEKEGGISEDDVKRFEKEIQKVTDEYIEQIGEALSHKEAELMKV